MKIGYPILSKRITQIQEILEKAKLGELNLHQVKIHNLTKSWVNGERSV